MSARTTAEVRKMLETAAGVVANASGDEQEAVAMAMSGAYGAVKLIALPIAKHRDALAAEVARLRADVELFQRSASQAEQTRRDLADEVARLKAQLALGLGGDR